MDTAIIILAAGASSRLGYPKQLLVLAEKPMLVQLVEQALLTTKNVVVVLGAHADFISPCVKAYPILLVQNDDWAQGMGSSIRNGLQALLLENEHIASVILSVCDQPLLSAKVFEQLVLKNKTNEMGIVACSYGGTMGAPVLFNKAYFPELLNLVGEAGAKQLLYKYKADCATIDFPEGVWDIDEEKDRNRK